MHWKKGPDSVQLCVPNTWPQAWYWSIWSLSDKWTHRARVNFLKCKNAYVTPLLPLKPEINSNSFWWFSKPDIVWPWTPTQKSSIFSYSTNHSIFPSRTVFPLFLKLTKLASAPGPLHFTTLPYCSSLGYLSGSFPTSLRSIFRFPCWLGLLWSPPYIIFQLPTSLPNTSLPFTAVFI